MNQIFLEFLNQTVVSSILIAVVLIARVCIKKAPKQMTCVLWGLVAIKLILPFHIESVLSLIPSSRPIPVDIESQFVPQMIMMSDVTAVNDVVTPVFPSDFPPNDVAPVNPLQTAVSAASVLWVIGMIILCMYSVVSFYLLKKRVAASKNIAENVWICDEVSSPFILGIIRPKIYLPSGMAGDASECVLAHEKAHLKRLDHIWKPFGFLILTVYWLNPLCWIAYVLFCRDIESACDEMVTKDRDRAWKAAYCQALLDCSIRRRIIAACPLAFGEIGVKDRVRSVLNYKKPAFWTIVVAVLLSVVVAACFMTSPKQEADAARTEEYATETEAEAVAKEPQEESETAGVPDGADALKQQLTIQELVRLVTSESFTQTQKEEGIAFWDKYENLLEDEAFHEESLTGLRSLQLDYDGTPFELQVYYWPEDTAQEGGYSAGDLDSICLANKKTGDAILLFSSESKYIVNTDIESFLVKKYELPEALLTGNACHALDGEISYSDYQVDLFLCFSGCLFENQGYREPAHGEWTPRAWYSLGGVGICTLPDYESWETFENGKLVQYQCMGNHVSYDLVQVFHTSEYSGCLYKYNMDLVTASETDLLKDGESGEAEHWVAFFTRGPGEPLYMKFFNCDYYSQEDALESVANGADMVVSDVTAG